MVKHSTTPLAPFSEAERDAVYKAMMTRRDVRSEFLPDPIADDVLHRILTAAHHAPSVGFMQPWDFIVIKDRGIRTRIRDLFLEANREAAAMFEGERRKLYESLKLEGILDTPLNLCITCDRTRSGKVVLGRTHMPEMDIYSTICAVQNLWLAARAEGIGVGWVSIFKPELLKEMLGIPEHIIPIAYLCIGHVSHLRDTPELESVGWRNRVDINELVHVDGWTSETELHSGNPGEEHLPMEIRVRDSPA